MLVQVYVREAVSRKFVYEWFKCFREGRETTEDEPGLGRPSTIRTPKMKAAFKRARFADVNVIKDHVTAVLRSIPQEDFADCFRKLYEHCQTCVVADDDYFQGQKKNGL